MTFTEYLQQKKYSPATVNSYAKYISYFTNWLSSENITAAAINYTELLDFIRHLQTSSKSKRTVNHHLSIVRHYFDYLVTERARNDNPAVGVVIKGVVRKLPNNMLSIEEMEELYRQYAVQFSVEPGKKIILGLLIYQGLTMGEIIRLEQKHIRIKEGKVFIKATKRTAERWLNFHPVQMMELQTYLSTHKFKEDSLLFTSTSEKNIYSRMQHMMNQLRRLNPKVINAGQFRSSVITQWLKQDNLRQVQYMAGHKYVSSTQRYQVSNLDELQNEVRQHHPME